MIQLQTLGDAVITIGDREIRPTSPTVFAAMLYLAVERGQRVPRAALQELLFPETDERSGAHSLRQLLYKLRQLGASIQAEGDVVWLAPEDVVDDYSAPAHASGNGNGNGNGNGHGTGLRGAFLPGYTPTISRAYDEWLEARRGAVETAQRRAQIKYMLVRRDAADWITVERVAQEVLAGDPFNEEATFALAESTALGGSKSEAIRILERYESETGRADLKLPAQILRRRISERLPDRRRRALDTPFVGRDAEAAAMRETIVQLRAGHGGTIVISGEPGIGKTRLLEETSALALLEGVNVHVVRCQPHYTSRPMGVFIEWVPLLMASRGALGVAPETMEHLKLLTSHHDDRADRPTDARDDATRSGTLMAAVRDLVDAVAGEAPIMLAVEDAHWADPASLLHLCTLLERRRGRLLTIVYTTRVIEPLKESGVISDSATLVRLKPLIDGSMRDLSMHLLRETRDLGNISDVGEWCARNAAGNPWYLQMLCAHFEETHQPFVIPPSIRSATIRRVQQLPRDSRRVMEYCSLLGANVSVHALASLSEIAPREFLDTIQGLEEAGFLQTDGKEVRPSHDLLLECTLELVPPLTRQLLHAKVAAYLEARYESTKDSSVLWDCAEHWAASGESAKALAFSLQCARHAADMGKATLALEFLLQRKALPSTIHERLQLLDAVAPVARAAGRWDEVLASARLAHEAFTLLQCPTPWQWRFRDIEAQWGLSGKSNDATDVLLECLNSADAPALHRVQAAQMLVRIAHESMDPDLAHRAFQSVACLLDPRSADYSSRMLPLIYHTSFGDQSEAKAIVSAIMADLERFSIDDRLRAARNCSVALCGLGEPLKAFSLSAEYYDRCKTLGMPQWQYDFACNCCTALCGIQDFAEADRWFEIAEALRRRVIPSLMDYVHVATGVDIAICQTNRSCAESRMKVLETLPLAHSERFRTMAKAMRIRISQLDERYQMSDSEIEVLAHEFATGRRVGCGDSLALALSEALVRRGARDEAVRAVRDYLQDRRDNGIVPPQLLKIAQG